MNHKTHTDVFVTSFIKLGRFWWNLACHGDGDGKYEFILCICHEVSNVLSTLVAREKPGFQV